MMREHLDGTVRPLDDDLQHAAATVAVAAVDPLIAIRLCD